jgi:membrane associated rhomboid family serine protease
VASRIGFAKKAPITSALLLVNVVIWLGQVSPLGYLVTNSLYFAPIFTLFEPWRMLTSGFVHDPNGPTHILLNSYAIWIFGRTLEPMLGRGRFLFLYLASIVGGSVAVLWLTDPGQPVVGASGALFGLMGAYFVVLRTLGGNQTQIFLLIAVNFGLGFIVPGISWEGHLGGLVTGLLVATVYARTRNPKQKGQQLAGLIVILIGLGALSYLKVLEWI